MISTASVEQALRENQIELSDRQIEQLTAYANEILEINKSVNLTAVRDEEEFISRNLIDSLLLKPYLKNTGEKVLDLGTGGGFPGIPLAIACPDDHFTLVDATQKKVDAVEKAASKLGLTNVTFLCARAEEMGKKAEYRAQFDAVVTRAVASLRILTELSLPLLRLHGELIAMKSAKYQEEIDEADKTLQVLGGKITQVDQRNILHSEMLHVIIVVEKTKTTPEKYPRVYAKIKKQPL